MGGFGFDGWWNFFLDFELCLTLPPGLAQIELKAKWEVEKSSLEKSKIEAETKYNEINEQVIA